ncbi:helix-turn-helix domain-containing protein [Enterococcus sp. DIV0187]|uniref:helix-turn-helix domain-containing protein n=1 Tax=Enterococcus sp. DIV0187 TaxID=2774644 RepID=UPI003F229B46
MENYVNLVPILIKAQQGDEESMEELLSQFRNLLLKLSKNSYGFIDEDCYQTLAERFIKAVRQFELIRDN